MFKISIEKTEYQTESLRIRMGIKFLHPLTIYNDGMSSLVSIEDIKKFLESLEMNMIELKKSLEILEQEL